MEIVFVVISDYEIGGLVIVIQFLGYFFVYNWYFKVFVNVFVFCEFFVVCFQEYVFFNFIFDVLVEKIKFWVNDEFIVFGFGIIDVIELEFD